MSTDLLKTIDFLLHYISASAPDFIYSDASEEEEKREVQSFWWGTTQLKEGDIISVLQNKVNVYAEILAINLLEGKLLLQHEPERFYWIPINDERLTSNVDMMDYTYNRKYINDFIQSKADHSMQLFVKRILNNIISNPLDAKFRNIYFDKLMQKLKTFKSTDFECRPIFFLHLLLYVGFTKITVANNEMFRFDNNSTMRLQKVHDQIGVNKNNERLVCSDDNKNATFEFDGVWDERVDASTHYESYELGSDETVLCQCATIYQNHSFSYQNENKGIVKKVVSFNKTQIQWVLTKHQHSIQSGFHIIIYLRGVKNQFVRVHYDQKRKLMSHIMVKKPKVKIIASPQKTIKLSIIDVFQCDVKMANIIAIQTRNYANNNKGKYRAKLVKENMNKKK